VTRAAVTSALTLTSLVWLSTGTPAEAAESPEGLWRDVESPSTRPRAQAPQTPTAVRCGSHEPGGNPTALPRLSDRQRAGRDELPPSRLRLRTNAAPLR
jgi:hypothetical protein